MSKLKEKVKDFRKNRKAAKKKEKAKDPFTDKYPKVTITEVERKECKTHVELAHEGSLKIATISDTHGKHWQMPQKIPECDILVHGGDFSMTGTAKVVKSFVDWLLNILKDGTCKHIVVIAGNHDCTFEKDYYLKTGASRFHRFNVENPDEVRNLLINADERIHYLEDESLKLMGINFYGSPWSPWFCDWAFNADPDPIEKIWEKIPLDTDILITHGPPILHGDKIIEKFAAMQGGRRHVGCFKLYDRVLKVKPKFHIFGHIHEGYGVTRQNGLDTTFINASTCNLAYGPLNKPILFHIDKRPTLSEISVDDEKKVKTHSTNEVLCCIPTV